MRKVYIVIDNLLTDDESWEANLPSLIHGYVDSTNIDAQVETITDISVVKTYFESKHIAKYDVFVFPNSWTPMIPYVKHWSEQNQIPVRMLGLWPKGCFNGSDAEYRPLNDRNWRKVHERGNFRCLDKSFFINEYFKEQFRIYVSKAVFPERLHICSYPLDYLSLEMSLIKDKYYKQDMVIFPWGKYNKLQEQIVYDFVRVFRDKQVIFAQEKFTMGRSQVLDQISKSKIAFLPYSSPNIGQEIYECLLLECIPLVPDFDGFKDIVPDEFRYPVEWTDTIFNYCKYAPYLIDKITHLMDHYDELHPLIVNAAEKNTVTMYDSEQIIREIFE